MSRRKIVKIYLFGSSGSGKSTAAKLMVKIIEEKYPEYLFHLISAKDETQDMATTITQTSGGLDMLSIYKASQAVVFFRIVCEQAEHFEQQLGEKCVDRVQQSIGLQSVDQNLVFINSDCRNNAYEFLKNAGFVFAKVYTSSGIIRKRRSGRNDIGKFDFKNPVEQIDQIREDFCIDNSRFLDDLSKNVNRFLRKVL